MAGTPKGVTGRSRKQGQTYVSARIEDFFSMSNFALPMSLPKFSAAVKDSTSEFAPARLAASVAFSLAEDSEMSEAVTYLLRLLKDHVEEIRAQAVESLATLASRGASITGSAFLPLLDDACPEVRAAVLQNGDLLLDAPLEAAVAAAQHKDDIIRYSAAVLLGALDTPDALEALNGLLDDATPQNRVAAALQLGTNGNDKSAAILEAAVAKQNDDASAAIVILAGLARSRSKPVLLQLAQKRFGSLELKTMAMAALMRFDGDSQGMVRELERLLRSRRKGGRMAALRACAAIPNKSLVSMLKDHIPAAKNDEEKSAALWALVETARKFPECGSTVNDLRPQLSSPLQTELDEYLKG